MTRAISISSLEKSDRITPAAAARLIAERTIQQYDTKATARDRVRKALATAVETRVLHLDAGSLISGHVAWWARLKWPGIFGDWLEHPHDLMEVTAHAVTSSIGRTPRNYGTFEEYEDEIWRLDTALDGCKSELKHDRCDAEAYRARNKKASEDGKRGLGIPKTRKDD